MYRIRILAIASLLFLLGVVYAIHTMHEFQGPHRDYNNGDTKAGFIKLAEFYFFLPITVIHFMLIPWILYSKSKIPYWIIIVGTIAIFVVYFFSKNPEGPGVPIVHLDVTTDW